MSTGKVVDNFNAGGIAAPIDLKAEKYLAPQLVRVFKTTNVL